MWFYIHKSPPHPPARLDVCFLLLPWSCISSYNCWAKALSHEAKNKQKSYTSQGSFLNFFPSLNFFQAIKVNFYVYLRTSNNIKQNKIHVAADNIAIALPPLCFWTDVTRWLEVRYKTKGRPNGTISKDIIIGVKQLGKDPKPPQHRHLIWVLLRQLS